MKTCEYAGEVEGLARSHPWSGSAVDDALRYLDLRADPSLIRTALEDFLPWSHHPAIQRFYGLLDWLNGPASSLESNDCAFSPPAPDEGPAAGAGDLECSGRVMILFRDLDRNLAPRPWPAFVLSLHRALAVSDPSFELGVIGTTLVPVRFRDRPGPDGSPRVGRQLLLSFWAWGHDAESCMANLSRVFANLEAALRVVAGESDR